ncbi:MAG: hypothetical protein R2824_14355 [Saprospiraceae bacterium]
MADQMIVYPTDLRLVARSRQESERLIDLLYVHSDLAANPAMVPLGRADSTGSTP